MTITNERRMQLEARIMRSAIRELLNHGFLLSVFDGEEFTLRRCADARAIFEALRSTDEDFLHVYEPSADGMKNLGWIQFVYGNEPGVVVADHTVNLTAYLDHTNRIADSIGEKWGAADCRY